MKFITALRNTGKRKRLALWRFVSLFLSNSLQNAKVFQVHTLNTFATLMMFINSACSVVQINVSETSMRHLWVQMKLYNKKDECFFPPFGFEALRFHQFLRNSDLMLESASNRHVSLRFWVMCNVVYVCKETIPHTSLHSAMNVYFDTWITHSQGHARPNMLRLSTVAKKHSMHYKCILCNNITREACTVKSTKLESGWDVTLSACHCLANLRWNKRPTFPFFSSVNLKTALIQTIHFTTVRFKAIISVSITRGTGM